MEYYSAIKKNTFESVLMRWMKLEPIIQSEVSQKEKHQYSRLKLKKVGKATRPFRYDLNQTPYDYTVKVRNRFKGLDLIDRVPKELWMEVRNIVQETGIKNIPKKKKCKKAKWLSKEALQIALKRSEVKSKGEKESYTHLNVEFQRIARRGKKVQRNRGKQ